MAEQAEQHQTTGLSDRDEVAYLNALDPHATTTTKPWELELTSKFLRKVAVGWIVVVMAVLTHLGVLLVLLLVVFL